MRPYIDHFLIQGCVVIPPRKGGYKSVLAYDEKLKKSAQKMQNSLKFPNPGFELQIGTFEVPKGIKKGVFL